MAQQMQSVLRCDSMPLNRAYYTDEGYLRDKPILTTVGIFEYHNPDGSVRRELRLPEEVFAPQSLASYKGKPVIITHDAGLITKDNVTDEQIGTILTEGQKDGKNVRADIIIHDTDDMKESGLKELSLGYNLELDETPGVWEGQPYDAVQRNIRINHLALVREARAGDDARLNIDSRDSNILIGGLAKMSKKTQSKKRNKKARRSDGVLSQEELKAAIEQYKARRAKRIAGKGDADETQVETTKEATDLDDETETNGTNGDIEKVVETVKDRRDRRDAEGDPETLKEATGVIANQDEDIEVLFDIIDTLLAEKAFDDEDPACTTDKVAEDEGEDEELTEDEGEEDDTLTEDEGEDDETLAEDEGEDDEELAEDEDEDEDLVEDEDEDEDLIEDEDDEDVVEDEDDAPIPAFGEKKINADAVDRMVSQKIEVAMVGRTLNMDGLEKMSLKKAKKKIIKAVRPGMRLDGKSNAYIDGAYRSAVIEIKNRTKKGVAYQKKQMFNADSRGQRRAKKSGAELAREKMIRKMNKR